MSKIRQCCTKCKNYFAESAPQRNYQLFATYGFKDEDQFRRHNPASKNCPFKSTQHQEPAQVVRTYEATEAALRKRQRIQKRQSAQPIALAAVAAAAAAAVIATIPDVDWGPYRSGISMTEEDYVEDQEIMNLKLRKHNRGGNPLWFTTSEEAACEILNQILNRDTQFITLVAEPGSGKTAVIHNLTYRIAMLPYDKAIDPNCITITTGMSDVNWKSQLIDNFKLRNGEYLWTPLTNVDKNHCVVHRSNLHKRIDWLLRTENQKYISNHIFIIDESQIADEINMTIDLEFKRLGLTPAKMKEYNININDVSATPDVSSSIMSKQDNHKTVILKNGEGYKGFEYYLNSGMLVDYPIDFSLDALIPRLYSTPRIHVIRPILGDDRDSIVDSCKSNGWELVEDDSENNYYISFKADENEKSAMNDEKRVVRAYVQPANHIIILLKNKYRASKRLEITPYTGLNAEQPADKMNTTTTSQGLVARYFGYGDLPEFPHNQPPMFMCNLRCPREYISFVSDFTYTGKTYTGTKILSTPHAVKELKNTWCGKMSGGEPGTKDSRIGIREPPFDSVEPIGEFLRETAKFENVRDVNEFNRGPNGYVYPRRSSVYNSEETRVTRSVYTEKIVQNGGGTHINREWGNGGSGQPYMIWPVYETLDSAPESVKYYVHYLIMPPPQEDAVDANT